MAELATRLSDRFGGAQAFFGNSGAEAIEAGLKYARKATGKTGIVALEGSFHGRTFGALSTTGQPAKRAAFEPLVPDVRFARLNDGESLAAAGADGNVACVLLEPVQGEGGIHPATPAFLETAAALAAGHGGLLFYDEIQCGLGRTGTFFAHEQLGIKPQLVALAKGLANGLPIGRAPRSRRGRGRLRARRPRLDVRRQPRHVRRRLRRARYAGRSAPRARRGRRREARRRAPIAGRHHRGAGA